MLVRILDMGWLRALAAFVIAGCSMAQGPIRVDVHLVQVSFAVRDGRGALVPDLQSDNFEVLEDGIPQKISFFARTQDVPMTLGLVADVSGSQEHFIKQHRNDVEKFLKEALGAQDRAFLVCFGNHLRLVRDYSNSPRDVMEALQDFEKDRHRGEYPELGPVERRLLGTAFYDAIVYPITERLEAVEQGSRALIVFSDGEDNSSSHHLLDAIETAQTADERIFAIRYTEIEHGRWNARNKYGMSMMHRLARETGGADFDAREKDLSTHFREIADDLRSSYMLAYHSSNAVSDDSFRKIVIRAKQPGLMVRSKTGYYSH